MIKLEHFSIQDSKLVVLEISELCCNSNLFKPTKKLIYNCHNIKTSRNADFKEIPKFSHYKNLKTLFSSI